MRRAVKISLGLLGLLLLIPVLAGVYVASVDLGKHKESIAASFMEATGRHIELRGAIEHSIYPWLGVTLDGLSIGNTQGFPDGELLSSGPLTVRVRLLPLLSSRLEFDVVQVQGLQLNLMRNAEGVGNWQNAGVGAEAEAGAEAGVPPDSSEGGRAIRSLSITQLLVEDATVHFRDQQSGLDARLAANVQGEGLSGPWNTWALRGAVQAEGPDLPLLLRLAGDALPGGEALSAYGERLAVLDDRGFAVDTEFDVDLNAGRVALPALQLRLPGVAIQGQIGSGKALEGRIDLVGKRLDVLLSALLEQDNAVLKEVDASLVLAGTVNDVQLAPLSGTVTLDGGDAGPIQLTVQTEGRVSRERVRLEKLAVRGKGLALAGELTVEDYRKQARFAGAMSLSQPVNPRELLADLGRPLPEGIAPDTLRHLAVETVAFSGDGVGLKVPEMRMVLDDSTIDGSFSVTRSGETPDYQLRLAVNRIDLDRYFPKAAGEPSERGAAASGAASPSEALAGLQLSGELQIGELILRQLRMQSLLARLRIQDGVVTLDPLKVQLYGGQHEGKGRLDSRAAPQTLALSSSVREVQIGELLGDLLATDKPYVTGKAQFDLQLQGAGDDGASLLAGLNGTGRVEMQEGVFTSFDIGRILLQLENLIKHQRLGEVSTTGDTRFEQASATLDIDAGMIRNDDLLLRAPGFLARGEGLLLDLQQATWDYRFSIATGSSGAEAGSQGGSDSLGGHALRVHCTGKISRKRCLPEVRELLARVLGKRLRSVVGGELSEALGDNPLGEALGGAAGALLGGGGGEPEAPGSAPPPAESGPGPEEKEDEKKDIEEEIKEKVIDGLLDQLL